jgi:hypothetical protein
VVLGEVERSVPAQTLGKMGRKHATVNSVGL